jgi:hypothetical protein
MIDQKHYRDALMAVNGASNMIALVNAVHEQVVDIMADAGIYDSVMLALVLELKSRCRHVVEETGNSYHVKHDEEVQRLVRILTHLAFDSRMANQVSGHPVIRMMTDQIRTIAWQMPPEEPNFGLMWAEAHKECKNAIKPATV